MSDHHDPVKALSEIDPIDGQRLAASWDDSPAKTALFEELRMNVDVRPDTETARKGPARPRRFATVVAVTTLTIAGAAVAVAQITARPGAPVAGPGLPQVCTDGADDATCVDALIDQVSEDGTDVQKALVADGFVAADEYRQVADDVVACHQQHGIDARYEQAATGGSWTYDLIATIPTDMDRSTYSEIREDCLDEYQFHAINLLWQLTGSN